MSDNARGAIAMLLAMFFFSTNDALIKSVFATVPLGQAMFVRGLLGIAIGVFAAWRLGALHRFRDVVHPAVLLRTAFDSGAALVFLTALTSVALGALTATLQATPLIATAMAAVLLGEPVGWRRWAATLVGLLGVLVIIDPLNGGANFYAMLGLMAALLAAARDLTTRSAPKEAPTILIALACVAGNTLTGVALGATESWAPLSFTEIWPLMLAAFGVVGGHFFISQAMRSGEVAAVAPFRYSIVLWAMLNAWLLLDEVPETRSILGAAIVIAAGLYTLRRERVRHTRVTARAGLRGGL